MLSLKVGIEDLKQAKTLMSEVNHIMSDHVSKLKALEDENAALKDELGALQIQPDSSYMKLPLDADGVPIHLGDTVWYIGVDVDIEKDCPMEVNGFVRVPFVLETFIETVECPRKAIAPESLTHKRLEPPDSWEKLENDAKKTSCGYASAPRDENGLTICEGCRFQKTESCSQEMTLDVLKRAKKLAGVEDVKEASDD